MRLRKKYVAVLAGLALAGGVAVPTAASASTGGGNRQCAAGMHAAVVEDNEAYAAKDPVRYEAILNPRVITVVDGAVTYGRDTVMAGALAAFATPGWTWHWTIESETVYGCDSGIALLDAHVTRVDGSGLHANATMTMVREQGKWTVAMDTVHVLSRTPPTQP
jgi:hypothetical protein